MLFQDYCTFLLKNTLKTFEHHIPPMVWVQGAYKVVNSNRSPISGGKLPTIDALDIDLPIEIPYQAHPC
jgi:hypothetical protein